jgi:hypothetical protein
MSACAWSPRGKDIPRATQSEAHRFDRPRTHRRDSLTLGEALQDVSRFLDDVLPQGISVS